MTRVALIAIIAFAADCAHAESAQPNASDQFQFLSCSAFQHNADGTWSPQEQIQLPCGITAGPGDSFKPGEPICGADLATELTHHCPR